MEKELKTVSEAGMQLILKSAVMKSEMFPYAVNCVEKNILHSASEKPCRRFKDTATKETIRFFALSALHVMNSNLNASPVSKPEKKKYLNWCDIEGLKLM